MWMPRTHQDSHHTDYNVHLLRVSGSWYLSPWGSQGPTCISHVTCIPSSYLFIPIMMRAGSSTINSNTRRSPDSWTSRTPCLQSRYSLPGSLTLHEREKQLNWRAVTLYEQEEGRLSMPMKTRRLPYTNMSHRKPHLHSALAELTGFAKNVHLTGMVCQRRTVRGTRQTYEIFTDEYQEHIKTEPLPCTSRIVA
jgi:hypothetical protein